MRRIGEGHLLIATLKPDNILVTRRGIKLLDFGLAKRQGVLKETDATVTRAVTQQGQILGTFQYMSPEQLQGKNVDQRSDLFSFGCVLYEMLTGKRAFEGQSAASVIAAILEREPAPLIPPSRLDRIVKRSLAKDPDQRFQTARDLKAALLWAMENPPPSAEAKPSRLPWIPITAATLAIGAIGGWAVSRFYPAAGGRTHSARDQCSERHNFFRPRQQHCDHSPICHLSRWPRNRFYSATDGEQPDSLAASHGRRDGSPYGRDGGRSWSVLVAGQQVGRFLRGRKAEESSGGGRTGADHNYRCNRSRSLLGAGGHHPFILRKHRAVPRRGLWRGDDSGNSAGPDAAGGVPPFAAISAR